MKRSTKPAERGLAQRLMDLEEEVWRLYDACSDPTQRAELERRATVLKAESTRLIQANLKTLSRDYRKVADALEDAAEATARGIEKVDQVRRAIDCLATLADLVARLA